MLRRISPGLDGRGTLDGDVAPVVELDNRDGRAAGPMFLSFTVRGREANPILPSNTAVETMVDCARPFGVMLTATPA